MVSKILNATAGNKKAPRHVRRGASLNFISPKVLCLRCLFTQSPRAVVARHALGVAGPLAVECAVVNDKVLHDRVAAIPTALRAELAGHVPNAHTLFTAAWAHASERLVAVVSR